jgi:hypothetical protein
LNLLKARSDLNLNFLPKMNFEFYNFNIQSKMLSHFEFLFAMAIPLLLLSGFGNGDDYMQEPALDSREQEAVYKVLEAINSDIDWRGMFPDNLCTGGIHGIVCTGGIHGIVLGQCLQWFHYCCL